MSNQETSLWCAVISQAIADATLPLDVKATAERLERQRARDWFTRGDSYFRRACELADLDPSKVRNYVLPLIAEAAKKDLPAPKPAERRPRRPRSTHTRGVGNNGSNDRPDRTFPATQDTL